METIIKTITNMYRNMHIARLFCSRMFIMLGAIIISVAAMASEHVSVIDKVSYPAAEPDTTATAANVRHPLQWAIKTNMLYDALAVPNIGVEFYLGSNFSAGSSWMYAWWKNDCRARYWRIYGGDIALRWWFGSRAHSKSLSGHHLGLTGGIFTYDFCFGGTGYMGGEPGCPLWDRMNFLAGIEYGYSLPISRRLNIDFSLVVGYSGGRYYEYRPEDGHYVWQSTHNRRWVGPVKAEISLIWLLGRNNFNTKGGSR